MSAGIFGSRFYGNREPAWHSLGYVSDTDRNAQEAMSILGSYWIEKRPIVVMINDKAQEVGDFALIRSAVPDDPMERILGYCTKQYNILQPDRLAEIFDDNVKCPVETMGMLGLGEKVFLTWKLPTINVIGDEVDTYGFIACGHDGKYGASLSVVTTRVVCKNTFNAAIQEAQSKEAKAQGRGMVYSGNHNSNNLERDLGIWMEHVQERAVAKTNDLQAQFVKMAQTPVSSSEDLANLLFAIYPDPNPVPEDFPEKLRESREEKVAKDMLKATDDRMTVEMIFEGQGTAIDATAWGLFNSVTEYENWGRMTKKPAEKSILMGERAKKMEHAYAEIINWIDTK